MNYLENAQYRADDSSLDQKIINGRPQESDRELVGSFEFDLVIMTEGAQPLEVRLLGGLLVGFESVRFIPWRSRFGHGDDHRMSVVHRDVGLPPRVGRRGLA